MLPGAVIAAQGAEMVVVQCLETGFGIDLGGRKIQVAEEIPDLVVSESRTNEPVGLVSGVALIAMWRSV
jgi:hypothetical protein